MGAYSRRELDWTFQSNNAKSEINALIKQIRGAQIREAIAQWQSSLKEYQASAPSEQDHADVAKIQKKLEDAKVRLARETGTKQPQ